VLAELCFLVPDRRLELSNAAGRSYERPSRHRFQANAVMVLNIPSYHCMLLMKSSRFKYVEIYPHALSVKIIKLNVQIKPFSISEISETLSPYFKLVLSPF